MGYENDIEEIEIIPNCLLFGRTIDQRNAISTNKKYSEIAQLTIYLDNKHMQKRYIMSFRTYKSEIIYLNSGKHNQLKEKIKLCSLSDLSESK